MAFDAEATITSKGQVTVPASIREKLRIKAGDRLHFRLTDAGELTVFPIRRHSIFDSLDKLKLPSIGRPVSREDIDAAIEAEIDDRYGRSKER